MSHSRELIDRIAEQVSESWPATEGYRLIFEKRLHNQKLSILPDIQVLDSKGRIVCAVEIGYTRPEKLTKYRELGIQDVRWYDKAGNLHGNVEMKTVVRQVRVGMAPSVLFKVLYLQGIAVCEGCYHEQIESMCGCNSEECEHDIPQPLSDAQREKLSEEIYQELQTASILIVAANSSRYFALIFCDECGRTTVANEFECECCGMAELADFECEYRRQEPPGPKFTYDEMVEFFKVNHGLSVCYDDFREFAEN